MKSMSEQQPTALLAKIKDDAGLREKLQGAADPNAAVAFAKEAGFEVSKAEWLKAQASQTLELEELSAIAAGVGAASHLRWRPSGGYGGRANSSPLLEGLQALASWF